MFKNIFRKSNKKSEQKSKTLNYQEISEFKKASWLHEATAEVYFNTVEQNFFNSVTSDLFLEYIKPTDKVLDVGAGTGRLSFAIADKGCEVVATDVSSSMMQYVEDNKENRKISTIVAEGEKLTFADNEFDVVVSMDLMVHFPQWQNFIKEKARVTKSGGHIIYNTYSGDNLKFADEDRDYKKVIENFMHGSDYVANCTKEELEAFCNENNLEIVKLQPYNFLSSTALWAGNLEGSECTLMRSLYYKTLNNPRVLEIITKFEKEIVKNLSHEDCATMIVVLREK